MSHKKTLTQLSWFKVAFLTPLIIGAIVAGFIIWKDPYFTEAACWTSECINDGINRLKVPITIMALIFPAVALVASQHRSAQTAAQIERTDKQIVVTEAKNAFENCIKHREIIFQKIKELETELNINCKKKDVLYSMIFTKNDYENFSYYINLDDFNKKFFMFNECENRTEKINKIRSILLKDLFIESRIGLGKKDFGDLQAINIYEKLISGLAGICLSLDAGGKVDIDSIKDLKN